MLKFAIRSEGVQYNAREHVIPNDGDWHYVVAAFQNHQLSLYLDGVNSYTVFATEEIGAHGGKGGIGRLGAETTSDQFYTGLIDGFRYYHNQTFTEAQLADLARNDGTRTALEANQTYTVEIRQANGKCTTSSEIVVNNTCLENTPCEDYDGDGYVVVCKLVDGSGDQRTTQKVLIEEWATGQQPGDYCGPCAEYRTIAAGDWDDPAVWEGGLVPPYLVNNILSLIHI